MPPFAATRRRLIAKVKTLEREAAHQARSLGGPGHLDRRRRGRRRALRPRGWGGGGNAADTRLLLAGAQAWHAQTEAAAGQMSAISTGLCIALLQS